MLSSKVVGVLSKEIKSKIIYLVRIDPEPRRERNRHFGGNLGDRINLVVAGNHDPKFGFFGLDFAFLSDNF